MKKSRAPRPSLWRCRLRSPARTTVDARTACQRCDLLGNPELDQRLIRYVERLRVTANCVEQILRHAQRNRFGSRLEPGERSQLGLAPIYIFRTVVLRRFPEGALRRLVCESRSFLGSAGHGAIVARSRWSWYSRMGTNDRRTDSRETVRVIDALMLRGFDDSQFRALHHFGASLASFRNYCSKVQRFIPGSKNDDLHDRLQRLLDSH